MENLVLMIQIEDALQSQHLLVELTGNKLLVEVTLQQQSRLMEHYGRGDRMVMDN